MKPYFVRRLIPADESIVGIRIHEVPRPVLGVIVAYTKLNRRPPAEADFQRYFEVTPPSVHNMIITLERRGLIKRTPGRPRSIEVLVPLSEVPRLD